MNLLKIDTESEDEWFTRFERLDDPLTKCLLLVAIMFNQNVITEKESLLFKSLLLNDSEARNNEIVRQFKRTQNLFYVRTTLRGHLGLPRIQRSDSLFS